LLDFAENGALIPLPFGERVACAARRVRGISRTFTASHCPIKSGDD
jgi:hypothetical protein